MMMMISSRHSVGLAVDMPPYVGLVPSHVRMLSAIAAYVIMQSS